MADKRALYHVQIAADASARHPGRWIRIRSLAHLTEAMVLFTALYNTKIIGVRVMQGRRRIS